MSMIESIVDTAAAMIPIITMTASDVGTSPEARSFGVARSPVSKPGTWIAEAKPHTTATSV